MKEMIYKPQREREILDEDKYKGVSYAIISQGTHPTAYVENVIPFINDYDDERLYNIDVHGGFTYLGKNYWSAGDSKIYLGWDYAHLDDFMGYQLADSWELEKEGKEYTTEEIQQEVFKVIDQLLDLNRKINN